jgi:HTH-type transcriptional regulator / antitoxin HigA
MTPTFSETHYSTLLSRHQPKLIKTEAENDRALAIVEDLALIERFETEFYQCGAASTPHSMLEFLMDQQNLTYVDLLPIFHSESEVNAVLTGDQDLTITQVKALADRFQVKPIVFV